MPVWSESLELGRIRWLPAVFLLSAVPWRSGPEAEQVVAVGISVNKATFKAAAGLMLLQLVHLLPLAGRGGGGRRGGGAEMEECARWRREDMTATVVFSRSSFSAAHLRRLAAVQLLTFMAVIDFPSKQVRKQFAISEPTLTPIKHGRVQLAIKNYKRAPCEECNKKVMLEITGGDYTFDRPGLDLVAVLDVSGSMCGEKMDQLKTAMGFVLRKLTPIDRLSVVTFSHVATKLCPLRQITEASWLDLQSLIYKLEPRGGTNIMDGLLTGLNVLAEREVNDARVSSIMLMSDGHQSEGDATRVTVGNVPVFTFGFGAESDPMVLSRVAANSMAGTFSHVQDTGGGGLTMAFSQCLAGLHTISVQDLKLTVSAVGDESTILKVTAGNYLQEQDSNGTAGAVTISFGNLYSTEVRKVIVDLLLPALQSERSAEILKATYSYKSSSSSGRLQFVAPPEVLTVLRIGGAEAVEEMPEDIQTEEARLQMVKMIKEARTMVDCKRLDDAQDKLLEALNLLEEQSNSPLRTELEELLKLFETQETYEKHGRPCALSSESSHDRQGGDIETMRTFSTPHMDKYLEQAKNFYTHLIMTLLTVNEGAKGAGDR